MKENYLHNEKENTASLMTQSVPKLSKSEDLRTSVKQQPSLIFQTAFPGCLRQIPNFSKDKWQIERKRQEKFSRKRENLQVERGQQHTLGLRTVSSNCNWVWVGTFALLAFAHFYDHLLMRLGNAEAWPLMNWFEALRYDELFWKWVMRGF